MNTEHASNAERQTGENADSEPDPERTSDTHGADALEKGTPESFKMAKGDENAYTEKEGHPQKGDGFKGVSGGSPQSGKAISLVHKRGSKREPVFQNSRAGEEVRQGSLDLNRMTGKGEGKGSDKAEGAGVSSRDSKSRMVGPGLKQGSLDLNRMTGKGEGKGSDKAEGAGVSSLDSKSRMDGARVKQGSFNLNQVTVKAENMSEAKLEDDRIPSRDSASRVKNDGVKQTPPDARSLTGGSVSRSSDQTIDTARKNTAGAGKGESVSPRGEATASLAASMAPDKGKAEKHTEASSRKRVSAGEMSIKTGTADPRSTMYVHKEQESDQRGQGGKEQGSKDETGITTQGKRENESPSVRVASNASTHNNEHRFDAGSQKSEPGTQGSPSTSANDPSLSPRATGPDARSADTGMIKKSFQEDGVKHFVDKASLHLKNGQQGFKIELKPEFLGQVKVQVSTDNHQVTIRIITELPAAKEMIENNVHQLKAELQAQGLQIDKFDVSLSQNSNRNGEAHRFSDSRKTKKGGIRRKPSGDIEATNDAKKNGWMQNQASTAGAINLFA
ncbi:MAG: flagellar hook-length control protein FliK [Desulfatiglandaceae bacterium]